MIATAAMTSVAMTDLDALARRFATMSATESDRLIAAHVALAVGERRIDDAVRWQRVRLRARCLRERARAS